MLATPLAPERLSSAYGRVRRSQEKGHFEKNPPGPSAPARPSPRPQRLLEQDPREDICGGEGRSRARPHSLGAAPQQVTPGLTHAHTCEHSQHTHSCTRSCTHLHTTHACGRTHASTHWCLRAHTRTPTVTCMHNTHTNEHAHTTHTPSKVCTFVTWTHVCERTRM